MNRQSIIFFLLIGITLTFLYSCRCSCDCDRNLACRILTVKLNSNDSTLMTKMFCSQSQRHYEIDPVLKDSVFNFTTQHQTDSTTVTSRDSIYKYERVEDIKCKDKNGYKNDGFSCMCYK